MTSMPSPDRPVLRERHDARIAVLRLNRPDRLNAVSLPLYRDLLTALQELADDEAARAVILTGAGRAFCVGADLKSHGSHELTPEERREYADAAQRANRALQTLPLPVIAAVNGHSIGAGLELALSCDFIVVADDAKLRLPELGLGTFVGGGVAYTLAQRVGPAKAKELIMLGEFFHGADAAEMGLATAVAPRERVVAESVQLAQHLAAQAPIPMRLAKELLEQAPRLSPQEAMDLERDALLRCMESRDWREGIAAFHDKRPPQFTGD